MRAHIRHLSRQVAELERPVPVDHELVLRIPDIKYDSNCPHSLTYFSKNR